jgi:hypothetical protein
MAEEKAMDGGQSNQVHRTHEQLLAKIVSLAPRHVETEDWLSSGLKGIQSGRSILHSAYHPSNRNWLILPACKLQDIEKVGESRRPKQ